MSAALLSFRVAIWHQLSSTRRLSHDMQTLGRTLQTRGLTSLLRRFVADPWGLSRAGDPERAREQFFLGRYAQDGLPSPALEIIESARQAMKSGSRADFTKTAFKLQHAFEELALGGPASPFYLDPQVNFNGPGSHIYDHYVGILQLCFMKARRAMHSPHRQTQNHSGFYFTGPRGVGKSTMLQTCALLAGQALQDHFVSVYLDASMVDREAELRDYLTYAVKCYLEQRFSGAPEASFADNDLVGMLAALKRHQLALGLFVNDAHYLYSLNRSWRDLHSLITRVDTCVFLTGSDSLLAPMVRRAPFDVPKLKTIPLGDSNPSLNDTKLSHWAVAGLNTTAQYELFFKSRPTLLKALLPNVASLSVQSNLDDIRRLHWVLGGRIRAMQADITSLSSRLDLPAAEIADADRKVLEAFTSRAARVNADDPFAIPMVPEAELMTAAGKHGVDVHDLVERKLIEPVNGGYRLAHPLVLVILRQQCPRVFVSHAAQDGAQLEPMLRSMGETAAR